MPNTASSLNVDQEQAYCNNRSIAKRAALNGTEAERRAVRLANHGYGYEDIHKMTGVPFSTARLIVMGY